MDTAPRTQTSRQHERRRQLRGLLLLALLIVVLTIFRTGVHHIFTPGWWRLW